MMFDYGCATVDMAKKEIRVPRNHPHLSDYVRIEKKTQRVEDESELSGWREVVTEIEHRTKPLVERLLESHPGFTLRIY